MTGKNQPEQTDTKKRILRESEKLFAEKGFDSTGIGDIASKVGIAKSVIYYHFNNKNDILDTILKNYIEEAFRLKKTAGDRFFRNGGTNYREIFRSSLRYSGGKDRIAKIVLMESIKKDGGIPLFDLWEQNADFIEENWSERLKDGVMDDPAKFILSTFFMVLLPLVGYQVFSEKLAEVYKFSSTDIEESFLDAFTEYFEKIILPHTWDLRKPKEKD